MSWVRANRARFDDDENPRDDEDRPLVPCYGRWAGRGGRKAPPFVAVYPDELKGKLRQLKFNPDVIIAEWKKLGWLVLSEGKGACKNVRVSGHTAAPLVAINLSAVAKAGA